MHIHNELRITDLGGVRPAKQANLVIPCPDGVTISVSFDNSLGSFECLRRSDVMVWKDIGEGEVEDLEQISFPTAIDLANLILKYDRPA